MRSEKLTFTGANGTELAGRLDLPDGEPRDYALFAHCFTCTKDIFAARRIAEGLAADGIAVLRFDFTGLGHSEGEFANTDFSSNVGDLVRAADHLRETRMAPRLLIGHSLGGAAVLAAAEKVPEAVAVATIGAPSDPGHVAHLLAHAREEIEAQGEAEVEIAGRTFRIGKGFLEDIAAQNQAERVRHLKKALLIFHAPLDQTVGIDNAAEIFGWAMHPKSFISLDDADHLLTRKADAIYVAEVLAAWSSRYLEGGKPKAGNRWPQAVQGHVVVRETGEGAYGQHVSVGHHRLRADEPVTIGGNDTGPAPYDFLLAGLGACTSMTVRMYVERKKWPLTRTTVTLEHDRIHAQDCADCETTEGKVDVIRRDIVFEGDLDDAQRAKLLEIADKCPVHRTLSSEIKIRTTLKD